MKKIAVALGFKGTLYNDILKAWNILEKDMGINYMSKYHSLPHITTIAGKTKDIEKIYKALNKIRIKKFKLKSPGMGIFANQYPNLYIRWEQNMHLKKISDEINKKTSKFFQNINQISNNSLWIPKTTLIWRDLNYSDFDIVFKKVNFIFNDHYAIIKYIYLIDYTSHETLIHTINLK